VRRRIAREAAVARPIWTGTITFGLLNIPVALHAGERRVDLHFRMLDSRDNAPIRYERVNSETGEEVPWKEIVKGFEYDKDNYIVLDAKDLAEAAPESTESVDIEGFVERDAISPLYFERPYYLVPGKKAEKGYVLLREVLRESGRVGIGRVVIRTREYLAAVLAVDNALVLNLLRFGQELVDSEEFKLPEKTLKDYRISERELQMAKQLLESMTMEWRPEDHRDEFRARLTKLVETRLASKGGKRRTATEAEPLPKHAATNVVDFKVLLQRSLQKRDTPKAPARNPRNKSDARTTSGARSKARTSRKASPRRPDKSA
jgi:DNA end-binding protein Ku